MELCVSYHFITLELCMRLAYLILKTAIIGVLLRLEIIEKLWMDQTIGGFVVLNALYLPCQTLQESYCIQRKQAYQRTSSSFKQKKKLGPVSHTAAVKTLQTVTNKPYVNEVTLRGQKLPLKCC